MITVLFSMTVRPDKEDEFREMVERLTTTTRAEDAGCLAYDFYRQAGSPNEALLFEQWSDQDALDAHIARLQKTFGPPDDDEGYPITHFRRRLPRAFLDLLEKADVKRYEPVLA